MGAGCSGAGAPFTVSSIQLTLVPSLYVWIALNSSEPVFDGSCPAETVNRSNWFGGIPPAVAVQVIFETASVIVPSSVVTGFGSFAVTTVASQPAFVCASADSNGVLVGKSTSSPVTLDPFVVSFGVEKLKIDVRRSLRQRRRLHDHVGPRRAGAEHDRGQDGGRGHAHGSDPGSSNIHRRAPGWSGMSGAGRPGCRRTEGRETASLDRRTSRAKSSVRLLNRSRAVDTRTRDHRDRRQP